MDRTPKKILGFLGLGLVAGMTIFAASLPTPEAKALSTSSVTDSIVVTVSPPPYVASVGFLDHKEDVPYVNATQNIRFNYIGVEQIEVTLLYTDENGVTTTHTLLPSQSVAPAGGTEVLALDMMNYGYGEFTLRLEGSGQYGSSQDLVKFSHVPVTAKVEEDENTSDINTILDYDENSVDIDHFEINVYDENGNLVDVLSPITVNKPEKKIKLPFAENQLPAGKYTVSVSAIDPTGNTLYRSWDVVFIYEPPVSVPNTGGLFAGLNISKSDYLITGLIVFAMVGGFGMWFIGKKSSKRR